MNKRKLKKARLVESVEELQNPGRGWYQIHTFAAEEDFSREELGWCLGDGNTLALAFIDIGYYRERALDDKCLSNIDDILDCFEQNGRDVILRIAYDREGRAEEREPYSLSQVVDHLEQLGPVLSRHAEHIFVYQGLLVGSWGEMHSSRFITENRLERLADVLGKYLGGRTFLAVRRPVYWRMLHPDGKLDPHTGMGLFDDGIFGSDTHLGTFGREPAAEAGWGRAWSAEEELDFEEKLCIGAPQGGEVLYEEGQAEKRSLAGTVERLKKMRISYLNCVYDRRILELWRHMKWEGKGPWNGVNGFDYIGRHLGYRHNVCGKSLWKIQDLRHAISRRRSGWNGRTAGGGSAERILRSNLTRSCRARPGRGSVSPTPPRGSSAFTPPVKKTDTLSGLPTFPKEGKESFSGGWYDCQRSQNDPARRVRIFIGKLDDPPRVGIG